MNLLAFMERFPTEDSCKAHFLAYRLEKGIICKKCSNSSHYWLEGKGQFQCKNCKFRTTLRSGTVLQSSKLGYRFWYIALHLVTATKKGFSAHEIKRQLNHPYYYPIWFMLHKIRKAMGSTNDQFVLSEMVELDDAYVSTSTKKMKSYKRGKGSEKKTKVMVMAESIRLEVDEKEETFCGRFKMIVNPSEKKEENNELVAKNIAPNTVLFTDKSTSYVDFEKFVGQHITFPSNKNNYKELKWVNIAIANMKRNLLGIYHHVKEKYLQLYLDEFCFKFNKRKDQNLFENLIFTLV